MACVNNVICTGPMVTSARRPFSHAMGSVTVAPAARYQSQAASRSDTLMARFARSVTPMGLVERGAVERAEPLGDELQAHAVGVAEIHRDVTVDVDRHAGGLK